MSGDAVIVEGEKELRRSFSRAADQVTNLTETNKAAAAIPAAAASARAPRVTGRLAASGRVVATSTEGRIEFGVIYAGVIHNGWPARNIRANPFAARALDQTEAQWLGVYEKRVDQIVSNIRGA